MQRLLATILLGAALGAGAATNTWVRRPGSDPKASNPANWSLKRVPKKTDVVVFSKRNASAAVWDKAAPHAVAGWIQEEGYVAVVTLETSPKDFPALEVAGDARILGGALTHPQNGASADWWLSVKAGGSIEIGREAIVSVSGKGFAPGKGPSPGLAPGFGASHGGQGAPKNMAESAGTARCVGSVLDPVLPGSGGTGPAGREAEGPHGGGVVRFEAGGDIAIRGPLRADADSLSDHALLCGGAAGGSVWLKAGGDVKVFAGEGGLVTANGGEAWAGGGCGGGGGRLAIRAGAERPDVVGSGWWAERRSVSAFGGTGETGSRDDTNRDRHVRAAAGTIYLERTGEGCVPGGGQVFVYNGVRPSLASTRLPSDEAGRADELRDAELFAYANGAVVANGSFSVRLLGFNSSGSLDLAGGTVTAGGVFARGNRASALTEPGTHRESDDARLDPVLFEGGRLVVSPYFPPAE
ncbi:MAG: hypothetical protein IJV65_00065 [Kiritimatiellae bacterium]|nr:hypothetical protein [Kiritimatiellia bacterium]